MDTSNLNPPHERCASNAQDRDSCEFSTPSKALPIWITDEDVYDERPSFILATVDKFARLAWEPRARTLFNRDESGAQAGLPPSLIIQDELHLISGPLGSMVGLYEAVIEELCTYQGVDGRIGPKIIASTATTRRYQEQVLSLFGRAETTIFPQAVSRANETFFSSVLREDGNPVKGHCLRGHKPGDLRNWAGFCIPTCRNPFSSPGFLERKAGRDGLLQHGGLVFQQP